MGRIKVGIIAIISIILVITGITFFYYYQKKISKDPLTVFVNRPKDTKYKKGEVIVALKNKELMTSLKDIKVKQELSNNKYLIEYDQDKYSMLEILEILNKKEQVKYAEPNYLMKLAFSPTTEPYYKDQWGLKDVNYGINIPEVWNKTLGDENVVVAVLDTGIDYNHPELNNALWVNNAEVAGNGIDDDQNGYIDDYQGWNYKGNNNDVIDTHGHGTHVSGIIGARVNGTGITGVAPNVKIMPFNVSTYDGYVDLISVKSAIEYAIDKDVKIFNLSFGSYTYSSFLDEVIAGSNALFICAAGNDANNNDDHAFYPANYANNNIISVAATDNLGQLASFSNYGNNQVDIAAPGENILSSVPLSLTPEGYLPYSWMDGTSMAAPYVSGLAALLLSKNHNYTINQLKSYILDNGTNLSGLNTLVQTEAVINVNQSYQNAGNDLFAGGTGIISDPYLIANANQLNNIRFNLSASYRLLNDIDLTSETTSGLFGNNGLGWEPIGSLTNPFTGNFDGNNFSIIGLNINRGNQDYVGLFGKADGGPSNIKNVVVENGHITGQNYVGSLIGYASNVNIESVGSDNIIVANGNYLGGIVGYLNGNMNRVYNSSYLSGDNLMIGGLVGLVEGNVTNAYNLGNINVINQNSSIAGTMVGKLIGNIDKSYDLSVIINSSVKLLVSDDTQSAIGDVYYLNLNQQVISFGHELTLSNVFDRSSYDAFDFSDVWQIDVNAKIPTLKDIKFNQLQDFNYPDINIDLNYNDDYLIDMSLLPSNIHRANFIISGYDNSVIELDISNKMLIHGLKVGETEISIYSIETGITKVVNVNISANQVGDINNDKKISITDLVKLRRHLAGLETIDNSYLRLADVNKDTKISITDLVKLRRYLAGLEAI